MNKQNFDQPIKLKPYLKETVWGGERLSQRYGGKQIGEAYLLSSRPGEASVLCDDAQPFPYYLLQSGRDPNHFPLLIKAIDAAEPLSVQVHPDDVFADACETEPGKHELWIIDRCAADAAVFIGFCQDVSATEIVRRCADGSVLALLNRIPVSGGEVFFIPAGTVHAIGSGVSLFEIQQNSGVTYRIYDYGRGRGTQLERAFSVLDMNCTAPKTCCLREDCLFPEQKNFPFAVDCCRFDGDICWEAKEDSAVLFLSGGGRFGGKAGIFSQGDCFFVPKTCRCTLYGSGKLLRIACDS